ncbi:MAG: fused MFS/spermidine synthase [Candidatus Eisenbacteria bacterium]|nr:fused MFS/spermidine synthase [Candidatus Eisenbacteria bacterium]
MLVRYRVRSSDDVGWSMGVLYAINTFGAMGGCLLAGFLLIASLGVRHTLFLAAAVNFVIGFAALGAGLLRPTRAPVAAKPAGAEDAVRGREGRPAGARLALAAIGISGFLALAYEVAWTRVLLYVLSASVYAFTIMLSVFLFGLALGSMILAPRVDRLRRGFALFGALEIGIGVAALLSVALLAHFPHVSDLLILLFRVASWERLAIVKFVEAVLVVFLPTLLMGMTFPLVSTLYARDIGQIGERVGRIVAVNTVGAVLGSFAAGFLLIPLLGTQSTVVFLAAANGLLGGVLLLRSFRLSGARAFAAAAAPAAALLLLSLSLPENAFLPVFGYNLRGGEIIYCREGITGTVTIHDSPASRMLSINGADVAGTTRMLRTTQKLQAHIPLLLHPDPRRVMQVGLGSGETAHSILLHPIERLDGVDISPEVIAAGPYFHRINEEVYRDPRLRIVIEDAKNHVLATEETYDLILNDSVHPMMRGSSDLYARDYFAACRGRLADDGMMSSWFPIGMLTEDDMKMLLHTFQEVFPVSTVWVGTNCLTRNALLLGWKCDDSPLRIDYGRVANRLGELPEIREDLEEVGLGDPVRLLDAFMLDPEAIRAYTAGARVNTFDRPYMEFSAPRVQASGDREIWACNLKALLERRRPLLSLLENLGDSPEECAAVRACVERRQCASACVLRGLAADLLLEKDAARAAYREALDIYPDDPIAGGLLREAAAMIATLEAAVQAGSRDPQALFKLARHYRGDRRYAEAERLLALLVELRPRHKLAQVELAHVRMQMGDREGAAAAAERAIELDSRIGAAYAIRGRLRAESGDRAGAESDLREAIEKGADFPWAECALGEVLLAEKRSEEAATHFRRALSENPDLAAAREGLSRAEMELASSDAR